MENRIWYYAKEDQRQGPIDQITIENLARSGSIQPNTLVWTEGLEDWAEAGDVFASYGIQPDAAIEPQPSLDKQVNAHPHHARSSNRFIRSHPPDDFLSSVKTVFAKSFDFSGRARRPEFWWFFLFVFVVSSGLTMVGITLSGTPDLLPLSDLFSLAMLIPSLSVGARRLHDNNRSGWWQLILIIPLIGIVILLILYSQKGDEAANKFGAP